MALDEADRQKLRYLDPAIVQKIGGLDLVAREVVEGLRVGVHKSPMRGFSTEFVHHRQYVPGDELRHIDWRVYARTNRYYVKLFEAETNFDANLLLDASSSMHYGSGPVSKLEYAKYMAASLAYVVLNQRDSVGLAVFDDALRRYVQPSGSMGVIRDIARELQEARGAGTNVASQLHDFARRLRRRGVVMLFSDLFDNVEGFVKGLDHLRFCGHNVTVFHVLDPAELSFPFDATYRFKGLEGADEILTEPRRIRGAYLQELKAFLDQVREACDRSHVDYVLVDTSRPIDEVLSAYLIWRQQSAKR